MILYLSGTGNTRKVAYLMSDSLSEPLHFIPKVNPATLRFEGKTLGIVCPVYAWGVSPLVLDFISRLNQDFVEAASRVDIWITLTCGDETAYAPEILKKGMSDVGLNVDGGWSVIMPNDYVLLPGFDVDSKEVEGRKLSKFTKRVVDICGLIKDRTWTEDYVRGGMPWIKSRLIYPLFRRWGIFPKHWHWTQECIGCHKCMEVCPVGNIDFKSGRPRWGNKCISCTACFHICPTHAVEYGNITRHKHQYRTLLRK